MSFVMFDGLDFDTTLTRVEERYESMVTRGFAGSPRYQHAPGATWRCVATPKRENDDLGLDRDHMKYPPLIDVGEVFADTTHEPPELIQILSLSAVHIA